MARLKSAIEGRRSRSGDPSTRNRHIDLPVLDALSADAAFWRPNHDVLGRELLLWRTNMFLWDPRLPWHEDRHSEAFEGDAPSFSTLLAMDDLPSQSCTVFVPGSHRLSVAEKEREYGISATYRESGNIRYAGQVAERFRAPLPLKAGEAVLFHPHLLHASGSYARERRRTSRERMILTFRITTPLVALRESAFPEASEDGDKGLRFLRRSSRAAPWANVLTPVSRSDLIDSMT